MPLQSTLSLLTLCSRIIQIQTHSKPDTRLNQTNTSNVITKSKQQTFVDCSLLPVLRPPTPPPLPPNTQSTSSYRTSRPYLFCFNDSNQFPPLISFLKVSFTEVYSDIELFFLLLYVLRPLPPPPPPAPLLRTNKLQFHINKHPDPTFSASPTLISFHL